MKNSEFFRCVHFHVLRTKIEWLKTFFGCILFCCCSVGVVRNALIPFCNFEMAVHQSSWRRSFNVWKSECAHARGAYRLFWQCNRLIDVTINLIFTFFHFNGRSFQPPPPLEQRNGIPLTGSPLLQLSLMWSVFSKVIFSLSTFRPFSTVFCMHRS